MQYRWPEVGEYRSYPITLSVTVPWDIPDERVRDALPKFIGQWIERQAKKGDEFVRLLSITRCPEMLPHPEKGERAEYLVRAVFKSRAQKRKLEIPDPALVELLASHPEKYNETMIS